VFYFSLQLLFKTFLIVINSWPVNVEMFVETGVGLRVKCLLLLFDFNQNCNMVTDFSQTPSVKFK
jgi:hypothetical protein